MSAVDSVEIRPIVRPVTGEIRPPGSKSLTNRALVVAALADGPSHLTGVLDSRDTQVMLDSLKRLGLHVLADPAACTVEVVGCKGTIPVNEANLWLENSGTSIRFLTAMCALGHGIYRLDGNERMRQRPIDDLLETLTQLGVKVRSELNTNSPPVVVTSRGLEGGAATVSAEKSSQFLSAALMAAPCAAARWNCI